MSEIIGIEQVASIFERNINEIEERQNLYKPMIGIETGFSMLDKITCGFQKSDLIILGSRPRVGKTSFALNIMRNIAVDSQDAVIFFSTDMTKEQLSFRLLTAESRVDSENLKQEIVGEEDWSKVAESISEISEAPIYIDDSCNLSVSDMKEKINFISNKINVGLVIIDNVQMLKGWNDPEYQSSSEIIRDIKNTAKTLNVPILCLSQLNRNLEQRADKRPMMHDFRDSGSIEEIADVILFIYRDEIYNRDENNPSKGRAEIIVAKNRNGSCRTAHLTFIDKYTRFEDAVIEDYI